MTPRRRPNLHVSPTADAMAAAAAQAGAAAIRDTLASRPTCNLIVATGASQLDMLAALAAAPDIDWTRLHGFHLDEYIGLPITHPASFRLYLWQRFVSRLPVPLAAFHYLDGKTESGKAPAETCTRVGAILDRHPIDVAFVGIGENGHLAFNDPPADFETTRPYLVVELDEACRRQQMGEGWFPTLDDVPTQAISMSVSRILASRRIICTVPDARKAEAVRNAVEGPVTPDVPASALQKHADVRLFLDDAAASLLKERA